MQIICWRSACFNSKASNASKSESSPSLNRNLKFPLRQITFSKDSGVPISARFCFYDQIHTTGHNTVPPINASQSLNQAYVQMPGKICKIHQILPCQAFPFSFVPIRSGMDIQHRLDAVAALTLGARAQNSRKDNAGQFHIRIV